MWIEVVSWKGGKVEGILQSDPFKIPDLKSGARVSIEEAQIFDYLHRKPDGSTEGNATAELLRRK